MKKREVHGMTSSPEYRTWGQMLKRCRCPKAKDYHLYGGRGIKVCPEWTESFLAFYRAMGPKPKGASIDRFPNKDGNYEPGNCRWATAKQQARNTSRSIQYEHDGRKLTIVEWSEATGISDRTLTARIKRHGWSIEKALTTPTGAPRKDATMLTHDGQTLTVMEWARRTGIGHHTIRHRLKQGKSAREALAAPVMQRRTLTLDGRTMTAHEWSAETGILVRTIKSRIAKGWSDAKVLTEPVMNRGRRAVRSPRDRRTKAT